MATTYRDREDEFDLGDGHSFVWFRDEDGVFGLIEHHPTTQEGALYCGGYVSWRESKSGTFAASKHQLVAGGPDDEQHLTVTPSVACGSCSSHGFIQNGRWEPA